MAHAAGGFVPKHFLQVVSAWQSHASAQQVVSTQLVQAAAVSELLRPHFGAVHVVEALQAAAQASLQMQLSMATYFVRPPVCWVLHVLTQAVVVQP